MRANFSKNINNNKVSMTLDLGCGHGFKTYLESKKNYTIGVDYDEGNIKKCRIRYPDNIFVLMNAEQLAFKELIFSHIIVHDVLEHVVSPENVLSEVYRVLRYKGYLDVIVPHPLSEKILAWVRPTYLQDIGHRRVFEVEALQNIVAEGKLHVKSSKHVGFLQAIYLVLVLMVRRGSSQLNGDTSIFDWRSHWLHALLHICMIHFDPVIWETPLRYSPIAMFTVPAGRVIEKLFVNILPKSQNVIAVKDISPTEIGASSLP